MTKLRAISAGLPTFQQACGCDAKDIDFESLEQPVHRAVVEPLRELKRAAAQHGIDLRIASGYRDFDRQLHIWNQKALGHRVLLDSNSQLLEYAALTPEQLLHSILRWSALPGASRHHWGTEVDIYDAAAVTKDYALQLTQTECDNTFTNLYRWLPPYLIRQKSFIRPYTEDKGGVSPEPWHISFNSIATEYAAALDPVELLTFIKGADIELKALIVDNFDEIYARYIVV